MKKNFKNMFKFIKKLKDRYMEISPAHKMESFLSSLGICDTCKGYFSKEFMQTIQDPWEKLYCPSHKLPYDKVVEITEWEGNNPIRKKKYFKNAGEIEVDEKGKEIIKLEQ